jgi:hypothetical protein
VSLFAQAVSGSLCCARGRLWSAWPLSGENLGPGIDKPQGGWALHNAWAGGFTLRAPTTQSESTPCRTARLFLVLASKCSVTSTTPQTCVFLPQPHLWPGSQACNRLCFPSCSCQTSQASDAATAAAMAAAACSHAPSSLPPPQGVWLRAGGGALCGHARRLPQRGQLQAPHAGEEAMLSSGVPQTADMPPDIT